ncbi:MAG: CHASE2 domain-containing protein, partial [Vulcanimicrobiota bacterium]
MYSQKKQIYGHNPLDFIDNQLIDIFFIKRYQSLDDLSPELRAASDPVIIIAIDDNSLKEMGLNWPIPRGIYGKVLNKLNKAGVKTVGFDLIFETESVPIQDKEFLEALKNMNNVILAEYFYEDREAVDAEKMGTDEDQTEGRELEVSQPYEPFTEAVSKNGKRIGFVSIKIDETNKIIRKMPVFEDINGERHYAFALLMAAHYKDALDKNFKYKPDIKSFILDNTRIPLEGKKMRINYFAVPGDASYQLTQEHAMHEHILEIPLKSVLEDMNSQELEVFKDRLVIIAPTANEIGDIKMTPFGRVPGVYAHVNIILSIFANKFLKPASAIGMIFFILLSTILIGLVIPRLTPIAGGALTFLFCLGYYNYSYARFVNQGVINYISIPIITFVFAFAVVNLYHHFAESREKESFKRMFKEFAPLPSDKIEKYIEESGGDVKTGGELAHVTVLFADIRGYTQMSETMSSQEVTDVLNLYHEAMGEIFAQTGGVIFTYIGDAQLVVYGMEGESKTNHAAAAIKAGLMMEKKMDDIKAELEKQGKYVFEVGVGLCTGKLSLSVVGSRHLKQYTVIGDTVNVASRIQGMSRELNSPCLIHERTYLMAKHCIEAERLR